MNSRIENGKIDLDSREKITTAVCSWLENGDIKDIDAGEKSIGYITDNAFLLQEKSIYFPETDSEDRIRNITVADDEAGEYINLDKMASFIFNCIDVNALACVEHIAFLCDTVSAENADVSKGRNVLYKITGDEYAFEVGAGLLGICWVERSAVIINLGEIMETARTLTGKYGGNEDQNSECFRKGVLQTIFHEFRHAVYELHDYIVTDGSDERYPDFGNKECEVEDYGNMEADEVCGREAAAPFLEGLFYI